jgi:hypothetical protein
VQGSPDDGAFPVGRPVLLVHDFDDAVFRVHVQSSAFAGSGKCDTLGHSVEIEDLRVEDRFDARALEVVEHL